MDVVKKAIKRVADDHQALINDLSKKKNDQIDKWISTGYGYDMSDIKSMNENNYRLIQNDILKLRQFAFWIRFLLSPGLSMYTQTWMSYVEANENLHVDRLNFLLEELDGASQAIMEAWHANFNSDQRPSRPEILSTAIEAYIRGRNMANDPYYMFSESALFKLFSWSRDYNPPNEDPPTESSTCVVL